MNKVLTNLLNIVLVAFLLAGCKEEIAETVVSAPEIKVSNPLQKLLIEWDEYTGRFRAIEEVEVRARVSGYLNEVLFQDGQLVEKGDVLFVIDPRPFEIALKGASAQFALTQKEYERANLLRKTGATSQEELDRRVQELNLAEAVLDRAKLDMEFTQVKAPISGRVSRDLVNVGNLVNGSDSNATTLTNIVAVHPIHFYFEASERNYLKYARLDRSGGREGSRTKANPVEVKLQDEIGYPHKGKMDFVDNRLDRSTGTILGRARIPNPDGLIQPGLFGRARLLGSQEYIATLIPDVLVSNDQARKFVYVVNDKNVIEMRNVTLGPIYEESWRIVRDGLRPDDQLVAKGIQRIRPGMTITPKKVNLTDEYSFKIELKKASHEEGENK